MQFKPITMQGRRPRRIGLADSVQVVATDQNVLQTMQAWVSDQQEKLRAAAISSVAPAAAAVLSALVLYAIRRRSMLGSPGKDTAFWLGMMAAVYGVTLASYSGSWARDIC
jgi:hypothetical protein